MVPCWDAVVLILLAEAVGRLGAGAGPALGLQPGDGGGPRRRRPHGRPAPGSGRAATATGLGPPARAARPLPRIGVYLMASERRAGPKSRRFGRIRPPGGNFGPAVRMLNWTGLTEKPGDHVPGRRRGIRASAGNFPGGSASNLLTPAKPGRGPTRGFPCR